MWIKYTGMWSLWKWYNYVNPLPVTVNIPTVVVPHRKNTWINTWTCLIYLHSWFRDNELIPFNVTFEWGCCNIQANILVGRVNWLLIHKADVINARWTMTVKRNSVDHWTIGQCKTEQDSFWSCADIPKYIGVWIDLTDTYGI